MLPVLTLLMTAQAQNALSLEAVRRAQEGYGAPSLTFVPSVFGMLEATLSCGGKTWTLNEKITPDTKPTLKLEGLKLGEYTCTGSVSLTEPDGASGQMPLKLSVAVLPPLALTVAREDLDLEQQTLVVVGDRPLSKVQVDAIGPGGTPVGHGEIGGGGETRVELQWSGEGEVIQLQVTAWDADNLPGKLELSPWSYNIPHEDVVFATGKSEVRASEAPKLDKAWTDLQAVLEKYGSVVEVKLFVAGYTDTVGSPQANLGLSRSRARSIAAWFRQRGFSGEIRYQGFGEGVLAVGTPDETDEAANRRAIYILAAETPPISTELPAADWHLL